VGTCTGKTEGEISERRAASTRWCGEMRLAARALLTGGEAAFGQGRADRAVGGRRFCARARGDRGTLPRSANQGRPRGSIAIDRRAPHTRFSRF
jgi:hypothetical protein